MDRLNRFLASIDVQRIEKIQIGDSLGRDCVYWMQDKMEKFLSDLPTGLLSNSVGLLIRVVHIILGKRKHGLRFGGLNFVLDLMFGFRELYEINFSHPITLIKEK